MKKVLIGILIAMTMFSITSYAGQWRNDENGYWYQNDDGTYKTGWYQDVDGKWYYMDAESGYMLTNTITPDGYLVSETGEWVKGGETTIKYNGNVYSKSAEFNVTAYNNSPAPPEQFGYSLPVIVYYNDEYTNENGRKIIINNLALSKDGILFVEFSISEKTFYYELKTMTKYVKGDGSFVEENKRLGNIFNSNDTGSGAIMGGPSEDAEFVSAEVYIDMGDTD